MKYQLQNQVVLHSKVERSGYIQHILEISNGMPHGKKKNYVTIMYVSHSLSSLLELNNKVFKPTSAHKHAFAQN